MGLQIPRHTDLCKTIEAQYESSTLCMYMYANIGGSSRMNLVNIILDPATDKPLPCPPILHDTVPSPCSMSPRHFRLVDQQHKTNPRKELSTDHRDQKNSRGVDPLNAKSPKKMSVLSATWSCHQRDLTAKRRNEKHT